MVFKSFSSPYATGVVVLDVVIMFWISLVCDVVVVVVVKFVLLHQHPFVCNVYLFCGYDSYKYRDFCLLRSYKKTEDGGYMMVVRSVVHPQVPECVNGLVMKSYMPFRFVFLCCRW